MTGLIFGKFDPFHNGHKMLLGQALEECDQLFFLLYDHPDTDLIPTHERARIIRGIIPSEKLDIIEAYESPPPGDTDEIRQAHSEYMVQLLPKGAKIDKVFCNEWYGEDVANFFNAEWMKIDPDRKQYPISSIQIRKNWSQYRMFLPDEVVEYLDTEN